MTAFKLSAHALLLTAASGMAVAAQAQTLPTTPPPEDEQVDNRIVVTGSRIATDTSLSLPSPVQVITDEEFRKAGEIDISQTLREIPALQGSDPATLATAQGLALTGASTLNLRQLGTNRTLVLQDGRRHVPGIEGTATVDVGSIPTALIATVEVLTGGASGVYGADAVSGVVNYIMRDGRDFDGIEYRLQTGISDKGDAEEFFGSLAGGGTFNDGRGSAVFAVEYADSAGIVNADRPNFAGPGFADLNPSNPFINQLLGLDPDAENAFIPDRRLPVSSRGSTIALDPTPFAFPFGQLQSFVTNFNPDTDTIPNIPGTNIPVLQIVDANGNLRAFNPGISTGAFNASGGDGIEIGETARGQTLIPALSRFNAAAGFDYEVVPNVTFFADAKFSYVEASNIAGIPFSDDIPIALDNPFLPQALVDQIAVVDALDPDSTPSIFVARDNLASETNSGADVERTTIRASGGLRWEAPDSNTNLELSYTWGQTDVDDTFRGARLNDRYFAAIDAVALTQDDIDDGIGTLNAIRNGEDIQITGDTAQVGDIVCRSEVTGIPAPAAQFVGGPPLFEPGTIIDGVDVGGRTRPVTYQIGDGRCAPINILGPNSIGGAGAEFAFSNLLDTTEIEQQQFLAVLSGDSANLFELPGGPIGYAVGFEYRRDTSRFVPDAFFQIEGNVVTNNSVIISPSPTDGQGISVYEGFGEIRLPLLADLPFVEMLEVSATGRISDYNTIGTTETYSFGAIYSPFDWLTFRGTLSRAIRAPNIGELFGPQAAAFIGVDADPCDEGNINNGSANRPTNCLEFVDAGFDSSDFLTAFVTGTTGGNPNLIEETSDSFTVGGIIQPRGILGGALDGFVLIADYYDIEIENAVGSLTGAAIAAACVDLPSTDNQFCDAIERNPANGGAISGFTSGNINLAFLRARGVDFETRYEFDFPFGGGDLGVVRLRAAGSHFIERFTESDPVIGETIATEPDPIQQELLIADQATVSDLLGVIGNPDWIVNFGVNWELDRLNVGWRTRWEDSALQFTNAAATDVEIIDGQVVVSPNENLADPSQLTTGDGWEHDFNISFDVTDEFQLYGGINNVFDEEPFLGSLARPVSPRGRFFFIGVQGGF
ncbi:TonB-dependent receptor domain-containing protein [Erythrobacter sp.]|jgi:outer membrane receptor protein involved in Fe transport|uniref:TonB-dependent receptor domain-containing protein n=1 Tax=Erythrobacter sp. TaxID=1042 RepID=UPI002EAFE572|nr:TonB-dependent receptor [Erythrobacter sp.]